MTNDSSYKSSFIFAASIHALLIVLLLVKFTTTKSTSAFSHTSKIINATAISERDFASQMSKPVVQQQQTPPKQEKAPVPVIKQPVAEKEQLQTLLQKNLLIEQAREVAELKKEQQKQKEAVAKQKQKQRMQKMQKMLQEQIAAEQKELVSNENVVEAKNVAGGGPQGEEVDKIKQAISSQWNVPEGVAGGDFCQLLIQLAPGGVVLDTRILKSSGNLALERSAEAAVSKASPLPVPEDAGLFDRIRSIKLMFRPEGIVGN